MEIKKSRKQQADETKRHIFDTALVLLQEKDFEDITVRDIVQRANVSVGSFYNHYSSKLDVYYETYVLADEFFDEVVAPAMKGRTFTQRYYLYFDYYARYSSEITSLALTRVLYNSANKCFDRSTERGMRPVLVDILRKGIADGKLKNDESPEEMAEFLMTAVRGKIYNWCTHEGDYALRPALKEFVTKLLQIYAV